MDKDLVSIIVPCYNVSRYLKDTFLSIQNQTYQNIEVIFVDDGSTDGTGKVLDDFVKIYSKAKVIHKTNGGLASARNVGIKEANGKFIYFFDSDDSLNPDIITILHKLIAEYDADVSVCSFKRIGESTSYHKSRRVTKAKNVHIFINKDDVFSKHLSTAMYVVWNRLYKTSVMKKLKDFPYVFNEKCRVGEDVTFTDYYLSNCERAVYCKNKLYYWRQRKTSLSHSNFSDADLNPFIARRDFFESLNKNIYKKSQIYFRASFCLNCMSAIQQIHQSKNSNCISKENCRFLYREYSKNLKYLMKGKLFSAPYRFGTMFTKPIMYMMIRKKI